MKHRSNRKCLGAGVAVAQAAMLLWILLLGACGGNEDHGADPDPTPAPETIPNVAPVPAASNLTCPTGTRLTYVNFAEAYFLSYCTTCHHRDLGDGLRGGAPSYINLDQPGDLTLWRANILARVVPGAAGTMPPAGNVPADETSKIQEWLSCGAPIGKR